METKRLFFGVEVRAPWPEQNPEGRLIAESDRHLTLAFLGNVPFEPLKALLPSLPLPSFRIGSTGFFDASLLLPEKDPRVVAWKAQMNDEKLFHFQKSLSAWLQTNHCQTEKHPWLPHVTLCRRPFDEKSWQKNFIPLPFYTESIHLYESHKNSTYSPLWSYFIKPPFEEIPHIADMAFKIYGESLEELFQNAFTALSFKSPSFLKYFKKPESLKGQDDLVIALNEIISYVDQAEGCPLKAVSFHGDIQPNQEILEWEMIVDV